MANLDLRRLAAPVAVDLDPTLLRRKDAGHRRQQRGLAHAVGAENNDQLAGLDREVDCAEDGPNAVVLREVNNVDHRQTFRARGRRGHYSKPGSNWAKSEPR